MTVPVSVYIITRNEEARIATAIRSVVDWADEVVVVDSGSTDQTVAAAQKAGARVLYREWSGYGPQKSFAEEQCRNEWILNIDADEEVSPRLAYQIQRTLRVVSPTVAGYRVRISDMLPGESSPKWFAYSYKVLRLYHRKMAKMSCHTYQDRVEVLTGTTTTLQGRIFHRSFVSWEATLNKMNFYSSQVAQDRASSERRHSSLRVWLEFPATFLKVWIGRRYILRGTTGFAMSITIAYLNLLRLLKTDEALHIQTAKGSEESAAQTHPNRAA